MAKSRSTGDLKKVYEYSENITKSREHVYTLMFIDQSRGATVDKKRSNRMERLKVRLNKLTLKRHDEIVRVYSNVTLSRNFKSSTLCRSEDSQKSSGHPEQHSNTTSNERQSSLPLPPTPSPPMSPSQAHRFGEYQSPSESLKQYPDISPDEQQSQSPSPSPSVRSLRSPTPCAPLIIKHVDVNSSTTKIMMVPDTCKADSESEDDEEIDEDKDIIYPNGVTDFRPYRTVARYRKVAGKSTDFCAHPLHVNEDSVETLILGLEHFAHQHNSELSFTYEDQQFHKSIYRATCGLNDLGSIHLLAMDSLLTATFQFEIDLDYDKDIKTSIKTIENFVLDFCQAISEELSCDNSNIRVFSIDKLAKKSGKSHVNFGLTTSDRERTKELADKLKTRAQSGFSNTKILKHVKPGDYEYAYKEILSRLRIRPDNLDPRYNFDYRQPGVPNEDLRGGYPYYLPLGWYRHALNVSTKYENDQIWLGRSNADGEWPVAFHGTSKDAVTGIVAKGFLINAVKTDAKRQEAIDLIGEEADRPGLYVATHCNGGSDIYTTPFTVTTFPDKSEQFRIVFQCRVQPKKFTRHTGPVNVGEAWRIVDPNAIRPYGILLKKEP